MVVICSPYISCVFWLHHNVRHASTRLRWRNNHEVSGGMTHLEAFIRQLARGWIQYDPVRTFVLCLRGLTSVLTHSVPSEQLHVQDMNCVCSSVEVHQQHHSALSFIRELRVPHVKHIHSTFVDINKVRQQGTLYHLKLLCYHIRSSAKCLISKCFSKLPSVW